MNFLNVFSVFYPSITVQGYTCGPCPLAAIKQGNCRINFDADFIFSEVNADKVTWEVQKDGSLELLKIDKTG